MNASWNPPASAAVFGWPAPSRAAVRAAATLVATPRPMAPPICWLALISPEATPASAGLTPAVEAMTSPTKASPSAAATTTKPGSRPAVKSPATGRRANSTWATVRPSSPAVRTSLAPTLVTRPWASPEEAISPPAMTRNASPALIAE